MIKKYPQILSGIINISKCLLKVFSSNFMNLNNTKKNLTPEIKKVLRKSKFEVLTNENDFLVKNLKKAG